VFKAGLAHAKEVAALKAAHPERFTAEAVAEYKKEHPERFDGGEGAYTAEQLAVFKAGFEHFNAVVAPWEAAHPEYIAHEHRAPSAEELAAYKAAHPEHFEALELVKAIH